MKHSKTVQPCFHPVHQKSTGFDLSIFYPLRKQWYIITRKRASHHRRCISSATGCISFRNDDIQNFVLMICNSCGIDDIHGFRRDLCKSSNSYSIMPKISFFIQAAGLVYHHRAKCGVYHQGRQAALVSHHASACIFPAA